LVLSSRTLAAALSLALSFWALRYTLRTQPAVHGLPARVRWALVTVGLFVAFVGLLLWGGSLLGAEVFLFGGLLAFVFLIYRGVSVRIVELCDRLKRPNRE
jgi:hypothetical protein